MSYRWKDLPVEQLPQGEALFPHLQIPNTKFDEDGVYQVTVRVPSTEAAQMQTLITEFRDEYHQFTENEAGKDKKKADLPFETEVDAEGSPTGFVLFKCKAKAKGYDPKTKKKWDTKVPLFDNMAQPLVTERKIGNGSRMIVAVRLKPWDVPSLGVGLTLTIEAVQVTHFVEYKPTEEKEGEDFGFGQVEGVGIPEGADF